MDQGCVCLSLRRRAWDVGAGIGVLIIIAVVKLKALARVVFRLGGGAWASGKQPISWKEGGVTASGPERGLQGGAAGVQVRAGPRDKIKPT